MEITLALGDYAHARTLQTGAVLENAGHRVALRRVTDVPAAIFRRARTEPRPFDVTEMSLATTYVLADRGEPDFVAVPVFPSRMFRHSAFYVRDAALRPEALRGKRVGVVRYGMTAAVWARGLLAEAYGIAPADVTWWIGEPQFFQPPGITLHVAEGKEALEAMLLAGELDCLFSVEEPAALRSGQVQRLFPDYAAAERAALARTGILPIMHTVLLRRSLAEAQPWLPALVREAFATAKREALDWLLHTGASSLPLPFQHAWADDVRGLLGDDPWPYGIGPNRRALETFGELMHAQGLTSRELPPQAVFTEP